MKSEEKAIEEMARGFEITEQIARDAHCGLPSPRMYAKDLYWKGYRKQSEGEWKLHKDGSGTCSECHITQKNIWDYDTWQNFCGHCGAKMKGGAE